MQSNRRCASPERRRLPRVLVLFAALTLAAAAAAAQAQEGRKCTLSVITPPGSPSRYVQLEEGYRLDAWDGVEATCGPSWVRADSATYYEASGVLYLYRNVEYRDDRRTLVADSAVYYRDEERVRAQGNVILTDRVSRSTLEGPVIDYFPLSEERPVERIFAPERSHLRLYADTTPGAEPFEVDADRIHLYGDSLMAGSGDAVAVRGELSAYGDSLHLDLGNDELWLLGDPLVEAEDVSLEGDTILVLLDEGSVEEIQAWPSGAADGRDMFVAARMLRVFVSGEEVERLVAWPGTNPPPIDSMPPGPWARAETADYILVGDSIDVERPLGILERVIAVGRARSEATEAADPLDPLLGTDWMDGDTIVGFFGLGDSLGEHSSGSDSAPSSEETTELLRLVALGSARALYHAVDEKAAGEATGGRPGINYVLGNVVTIWFKDSKVVEVEVIGPGTGVYLEPIPPATNGDSTVVQEDTASAASASAKGSER